MVKVKRLISFCDPNVKLVEYDSDINGIRIKKLSMSRSILKFLVFR